MQSKSNRAAIIALSFIFLISPFAVSAQSVDTSALIASLLAKVLDLNQKIIALGGTPIAIPPALTTLAHGSGGSAGAAATSCTISRTLAFGSHGEDVKCLQTFLIAKNLLAPDSATGYFGRLTRAAVIVLQKSRGLEQVGFVGRLTRALINKIGLPIGAKSLMLPPATTPAPLTYGDGGGGGDGGGNAPQALISPVPPCTFDRSLIDSCVIQ